MQSAGGHSKGILDDCPALNEESVWAIIVLDAIFAEEDLPVPKGP